MSAPLTTGFALALIATAVPPDLPAGSDLAPPVAVTAGGETLDLGTETRGGHPFPWFGDYDGDGRPDLLVGQAGRGKSREGHLRVYRNLGAGPRLDEPFWFDDRVPTGRIPDG